MGKYVSVFDPLKAWVRRTVRKRMRPMSVDEAAEKREMFSALYLMTGFVMFCFVTYKAVRRANDLNNMPDEERLRRYALYSDDDKEIKIIRFNNFTKVKEEVLTSEQIAEFKEKERRKYFQ